MVGVRCPRSHPRKHCSWGADRAETPPPRRLVSPDSNSRAPRGMVGFQLSSTCTWHGKMRSLLTDYILSLGVFHQHHLLLLLGLVSAPLQLFIPKLLPRSWSGREDWWGSTHPDHQNGSNKPRNPSTVVKPACLMSQLAPVWMHAGKIIWSDRVEGLNNIYQKGAAVTCRHCPMAELRSSGVIWWQLGAPAEAPAVILQTEFLSSQRHIISRNKKSKDIINILYLSYLIYAPKHKLNTELV